MKIKDAAGFMAVLLCLLLLAEDSSAMTLHIAPSGNDSWTGASPVAKGPDGPFATLEGARDHIRKIRGETGRLPEGGTTVIVEPGVYRLTRPLILGREDSGTREAPVVYMSRVPGGARINGGNLLEGFEKVTDLEEQSLLPPKARGQVLRSELRKQGIGDFGALARRGFRFPNAVAPPELIFDHAPMRLARWPNGEFLRIDGVPDGENGLLFRYGGVNPAGWSREKDVWVFGYWRHDWADEFLPVRRIDAENRTVETVSPGPAYGLKAGQRFYFFNVLSELDEPGEWYLDRESGWLYFWPPAPVSGREAELTHLQELLRLKDAANVEFRGFVFENARGTAITIEGGNQNRISGCEIRNTGDLAAKVSGSGSGVIDCHVHATGGGGIHLDGGDRKTLKPAGLYAVNNRIHDYNRWSRTVCPAVRATGVGNVIAHNLIYDAPHEAIDFLGNDHRIEYNEIHHVLTETDDAGAVYTGRDWAARGTVIRYNYLHDMGGYGRHTMGVYLDDQASGISVEGNVFFRMRYAAFIGGGRDNRVVNNVFFDCDPAVHLDARGLGWQKEASNDPAGPFRKNLASVPYDREPYITRYPELADVLDSPGTPRRNLISRNLFFGGKWDDIAAGVKDLQVVKDNWISGDPGFSVPSRLGGSPKATDFALSPGAPGFETGFRPIPLHRIGPVPDPSADPP